MAEVYYSYTGKPYLVIDATDLRNLPKKVTQIKPPEGIYEPYQFDEVEEVWIGSSKEEFEKNLANEQSDNTESVKDEKDLVIEDLTEQLANTHTEINTLRESVMDLTEQVANIQGGTTNG
ncbi:hypothetical protein [Staphylococcus pasteuri]|uniref:hypothetical protein n=1 Tax=Staphylococcus pasteuri TaxID=45972 RepID=UPI001E4BFBA3|nr:hypothetical protein [Staphylococcus pasteuri]MCE3022532.1 hypothetical protein [Staphylococcus pasteuri]